MLPESAAAHVTKSSTYIVDAPGNHQADLNDVQGQHGPEIISTFKDESHIVNPHTKYKTPEWYVQH